MSGLLLWESVPLPQETFYEAAERFVREHFSEPRTIQWQPYPGIFHFMNSVDLYQLNACYGRWRVYRLEENISTEPVDYDGS